MQHFFNTFLIIIFVPLSLIYPQNHDFEVYIIDAFVTPEIPHTLKLSFFTSEQVKSKIVIDNQYYFDVSTEFTEDHSTEIDFSNLKFSKKYIPYQILGIDKNGDELASETFEIILPYEEFIETKEGSNPIQTILFGVSLYLLPSPNYIIFKNDEYFSLTKEIPIITFYSGGYNYPTGTLSFEYTHIYDNAVKNIIRLGYKQIIPIKYIEYISPGISGFSNLNGFNGIGAEFSIGLFKIYDIFTVYSRYRYNFQPESLNKEFNELSIGLYSNFFTIDF